MSDVHHHHYYGEKAPSGGPPPAKKTRGKTKTTPAPAKPKRKGKRMTRKTQLAINKGRRAKGMKPIKWKKKGR